jgi:DNA-binding NarL/FixJ family response regulator
MSPTPPPRVAVTSDQALVAEAIAAALAGRDFDTVVLGWPAAPGARGRWRSAGRGRPSPDVLLLLSDLDRPVRIQSALRVLGRVPAPSVVLAGAPRGPLWGALLEGGATVVAPVSTGLDDVVETLRDVAAGRPVMPEDDRSELLAAWHEMRDEQQRVAARLATMTPREEEVLRLLYAGTPVREIAARLEVSEATVRSQVQRVLRKLDVRSQLAAVAALSATVRSEDAELAETPSPPTLRDAKASGGGPP